MEAHDHLPTVAFEDTEVGLGTTRLVGRGFALEAASLVHMAREVQLKGGMTVHGDFL